MPDRGVARTPDQVTGPLPGKTRPRVRPGETRFAQTARNYPGEVQTPERLFTRSIPLWVPARRASSPVQPLGFSATRPSPWSAATRPYSASGAIVTQQVDT